MIDNNFSGATILLTNESFRIIRPNLGKVRARTELNLANLVMI